MGPRWSLAARFRPNAAHGAIARSVYGPKGGRNETAHDQKLVEKRRCSGARRRGHRADVGVRHRHTDLTVAGGSRVGGRVIASPTPSPAPADPSSPPLSSTRYRLSGLVIDEAGSPIAGAVVEVDHGAVQGGSPTSQCVGAFCWLSTRTNASGEYSMEVEAGPLAASGAIGHQYAPGIGYIYSFAPGYETNVQWVPPGGPLLVQNLQLRPERPIRPGESTSVSVGPTSMLCTDLEDWWLLGNRCEVIQVESSAGTLIVDVRAASDAAVPLLFWATSGNYAGRITRPSPSTVSIPVSGGTYRIFVGLPEGTPTERFDVVTSLR